MRSIANRALLVVGCVVVFVGLGLLVRAGYSVAWTGFASSVNGAGDTSHPKTLWDWLDLLVVPLVLAVGAFVLEGSRKRSELRREADHQRQQVLDSYFTCITELLLNNKLSAGDAADSARTVARTRTLSALRQLDGRRKAQLLQFISEAGLIAQPPMIQLNGADLCGADLSHANLVGTELRGVHLRKASLRDAKLSRADLRGSDFSRADLRGATLNHANLAQAILRKAVLVDADTSSANLADVDASGAKPRM